MRALLKLVPAILAAAGLSSAADAQLKAAALPEIHESYNDCFAATLGGIDGSKLEIKGWNRAKVNGKPSSNPSIYSNPDRSPLIMLNGKGRKGMCAVIARLENDAAFDKLIAAWNGIKLDKNGQATFMAEGHPIIIAKTGSEGAPSVRLVVGPPVEQN
jgi:hypothetical protein